MILQPENIPSVVLPATGRDNRSLGHWYAEPLERAAAAELGEQARRALQQACLNGSDSFPARLQHFVAGFWLGHSGEAGHATLVATTGDTGRRALLDLVYGQLLVSCKLDGAQAWLDSGFARAAHLLSARDYFRVMKRHALLRHLVLGKNASEPLGLDALLEEARIIRCLTDGRGNGSDPLHSPKDTLG